MAHIYIAFADTPGIFAALIRKFLNQRYIHVVISGDAEFTEAYSVGRRNPAIPFCLKNQYTCSSYIAELLQENGILISNKHFSIVTPKDFFEYREMEVVFEGFLSEITEDRSSYVPESISAYE